LRIEQEKSDNGVMELESAQNLILLSLALAFLVGAVVTRRVFLSLFFSFAFSLLLSGMLLSLGRPVLAFASFAFSSGLCYTILISTSFLIGSHNGQRPNRRLSVLRSLSVIIVMSLAIVIGLTLASREQIPLLLNHVAKFEGRFVTSTGSALTYVLLALMSLAALLSSLLLIRYDEVIDNKGERNER